MELKVSAEKPGFSSSDGTSDPDELEISECEDEDEDRNHKHRRREACLQSLEENSLGQGFTKPYRKRSRPFQNGYSYKEDEPQSSETWKSYPERDFGPRFEKKSLTLGSFSSNPLDLGQRSRGNHPLHSKNGNVRGRGMDPFSWGICDPRLSFMNVSSQIVQPGPSGYFAGMSMPNVSNSQGSSWAPFGMIPGVPGGLDPMHPLSLQGGLGPAVNPPMNIGIPRQRCRDFEERGFCLRGDICPMEHGINRIVVDDFQSLSQFNLPVSVPGSQLIGTSSGQGTLPTLSASSGSLVNSKSFQAKGDRSGATNEGFGLNDGGLGGSLPVGSDVYDPDQPLLSNENPETAAALLSHSQPNVDGTDSFADAEGFGDATGSQSFAWGRLRGSRNSLGVQFDIAVKSPYYPKQNGNGEEAMNKTLPDIPHQGLLRNVDGNGLLGKELSSGAGRNLRKPSQKALCTLFVNGIPMKDNKREALLAHFRKFGDVIDIYIPTNSERAFVQFSRKETAELALKSPDAVMGNRFIKLLWANRDNIPDFWKQGTSNMPIPHGMMSGPSPSHPIPLDKVKETPRIPSGKDGSGHAISSQTPPFDHRKPISASISKSPSLQQKKMENLEHLKDELRKKQQLLDQKKDEFKRQLDKLQKQAVSSKNVTISDQSSKSLQDEMVVDSPKAETSESSVHENVTADKAASAEQTASPTPATYPTAPGKEILTPTSLPPVRQRTTLTPSRFKLDNRPTAFRIASPLPTGLSKIDALEEHLSTFGGLSSVELEESDGSAHVYFKTRQFAEKAFSQGQLWKDHKLHFAWLTPVKSGKENGVSIGNPQSSSDPPTEVVQAKPSVEDGDAATISHKASETSEAEPVASEFNEGSTELEKGSPSPCSPSQKQLS